MEYKSTPLELKDLNKGDRTAVIAFATYDNIDLGKDILRKGAFTKSWTENKSDIRLFYNHDQQQTPGRADDFSEDDSHAYVKAYFGTHTLGEDVLKMLDEKIITDASFGFSPVRTNKIEIKGETIRELKELKLHEASVLSGWGMNPLSKVRTVNKNLDLNLSQLQEKLGNLERFCHNTTASDECIKHFLSEIKAIQKIISEYDTAITSDGTPIVSANEMKQSNEDLRVRLLHIKMAI